MITQSISPNCVQPAKSLVAAMPRNSSNPQAEASDGDGETNDDAKEKQELNRLQSNDE